MREEGILTGDPIPEDEVFEAGLRPRRMDEFIGQLVLGLSTEPVTVADEIEPVADDGAIDGEHHRTEFVGEVA